jgi:hypothetical protein
MAEFKAPHASVKTIQDLIHWEYAKLIARAARLGHQWGFIMSRYKKLKLGEIKHSSIMRDDLKALDFGKQFCIYCESTEDLAHDHLIPKARGGPDTIHNIVIACKRCNSSKRDRDVFEWYGADRIAEIPNLVLAKYLKLVEEIHRANGTLDSTDLNEDGELNILDLGFFYRARIEETPES